MRLCPAGGLAAEAMKNVDAAWGRMAAALLATREQWRRLQWDHTVPVQVRMLAGVQAGICTEALKRPEGKEQR